MAIIRRMFQVFQQVPFTVVTSVFGIIAALIGISAASAGAVLG
jgi:hypothetical protein